MRLRLIRHATLHVRLAGRFLLVDPVLGPGPVELPEPAEVVVKGLDAALVTRVGPDRLDAAAVELLPADLPLFGPPALREHGFTDVRPVDEGVEWNGVRIAPATNGIVLAGEGEPVLYLAADATWDEAVDAHDPDVVMVGAGADTDGVVAVARRAPEARVVVVDVEADTRADLHQRLHDEDLTERVTVPEDGAEVPLDR